MAKQNSKPQSIVYVPPVRGEVRGGFEFKTPPPPPPKPAPAPISKTKK